MTSEPVIRMAEPAEGDMVGVLTEQVYREGGFTNNAYSAVLLDGPARVRNATVLVALLDGSLVGSLTLAVHGTPFADICRADELEVRMLAVTKESRRRGIADLLMNEAEAHARALGLQAVVLSTEPLMQPAHRLYERRGYRRAPQRDWKVSCFNLLAYRLDLS